MDSRIRGNDKSHQERRGLKNLADWWREFFSGDALEFVRSSRDEERTRAEAGFIHEAMGLPVGAKVLDVPCGSGRIALELAASGCEVTGVDMSQSLLDDGRARADARRLPIRWKCGDMRDLPWVEEFDGAVCFWSSFGYFDEQGNIDFLEAVSRALKPGAPFVLDTPLVENRVREILEEPRVWWSVGELLVLEERRFDHETSRVESDWTFIRDGRRSAKRLSLRIYTYRELALLLEQAGFGEHRAYGSMDFEPFEAGSNWLYMVTRKLERAG